MSNSRRIKKKKASRNCARICRDTKITVNSSMPNVMRSLIDDLLPVEERLCVTNHLLFNEPLESLSTRLRMPLETVKGHVISGFRFLLKFMADLDEERDQEANWGEHEYLKATSSPFPEAPYTTRAEEKESATAEAEGEGRRRHLFDETVKLQPQLPLLKEMLLMMGGHDLVLQIEPTTNSDVPRLIDYGFVMHGPVLCVDNMEPHMCHQNVAALWQRRSHNIVGFATGYALYDGLWYQHSWGINRNGAILETNGERDKYFGIVYGFLLGDGFAEAQLAAVGA